MKILLIEDDDRTASFIMKGLAQEGYVVNHTANGEDGLHFVSTETYDVAVVDIMLPKLDGLNLVREMRKQGINTPVIILSAKSSVEERITGLHAGGDDYLVKPFAFAELLARIQTIIRRTNAIPEATSLKVSELVLDLVKRKVLREGREIVLQPGEFVLLAYLMRNAGKVVSKTMIIEHVWDYGFDPGTNIVETRICRLRDKIDKPFKKKLLRTVRGFGYVIEEK